MILECEKCKKKYKYPSQLKRHLNRKTSCYSGQRSYKCDRCQKEFKKQYYLTRHLERKNICKEKLSDEVVVAIETRKTAEIELKKVETEIKREHIKGNNIDKKIKLYELKNSEKPSVIIQNLTINNTNINSIENIQPVMWTQDEVSTILSKMTHEEIHKAFLEYIFCNPRLEENKCIVNTNLLKNELFIKERDSWSYGNINDSQLIKKINDKTTTTAINNYFHHDIENKPQSELYKSACKKEIRPELIKKISNQNKNLLKISRDC